jgi:hypothetical protein
MLGHSVPPHIGFIDQILADDLDAPKKQHHTPLSINLPVNLKRRGMNFNSRMASKPNSKTVTPAI